MVFQPYNDKAPIGLGLVKYLEANRERERENNIYALNSVNKLK